MEAICSSEKLVLTRATRRHIPEDGVFYFYTLSGLECPNLTLRFAVTDIYEELLERKIAAPV
jgi:hypothetical protein